MNDVIDWVTLVISFCGAIATVFFILLTRPYHRKLTDDNDFNAIQKFHVSPVPRIGGVALLSGLIVGGVHHGLAADNVLYLAKWAGVAAIPVFLGGLLEDLNQNMSARERLLLAFFSSTIAYYELNVGLNRIDWEWFDLVVLPAPGVSLLLTVVMIGGGCHATNIIDGFNGLLLGVAVLSVGGLISVANQVGDQVLVTYFSILLGALTGVFVLNFPWGRIFLGDGGAYLIGFLLAVLSLVLVKNHNQVSPWFPLVLFAYPVTETLFSIFRKKYISEVPAMAPDKLHFHMLVFQFLGQNSKLSLKTLNSLTSTLMWLLSLVGMLPALIFWDNTLGLTISLVGFWVVYLGTYFGLVRLLKLA